MICDICDLFKTFSVPIIIFTKLQLYSTTIKYKLVVIKCDRTYL